MSSVNKVILIGNVGKDPEIRHLGNSGDRVANFSLATSENWKDKTSGERKEKTEWHNIVVFNQGLVKLAEAYIKKGDKLYIEGQIETRSWDQDGTKKYMTEIVLRPFRSEITMLGSKSDNAPAASPASTAGPAESTPATPPTVDEMEDQIPF